MIMIIMLLAATAAVIALAGCSDNVTQRADAAERIQVDDTHVYLAPTGAPSTFKLNPIVYPIDTASQKVYYKLADSSDKKYLSVNESGVLQAKGIQKTDEEGNNLDIIVRIISAATPSVSLDVTVTIETVAVEKILFAEQTVVVELHEEGIQLNPIFYPAHAITGRDVIYTSQDESIATVDSNGFVRPVGIGKVAIWVTTPRQGAFDTQVEAHVNVDVRYSTLNYRLDLTTDRSTLKQIYGQTEPIGFVLSQLDDTCDPSPSILWYVNTTPIDGVGIKDNKVLNYNPSTLPVGEYNIRAVLDNSTQRQELISETITIYSPLNDITLDVLNSYERFVVDDSINLLITYQERVYPPESYRWTIVHTSREGAVETTVLNRAPAEQSVGNVLIPDLSYLFEETGKYEITAEAIVKGVASGIFSETVTVEVYERPEGNDITDPYIEGTRIDGTVYPLVKWRPLPYDTGYTVEIDCDGAVTTMTEETHRAYFGVSSVYLPPEAATLDKDFAVRIKSDKYNAWTEWMYYKAGDVRGGAYPYLDEYVGGHNRYITDMRELGDLLNYLAVFRPTELMNTSGQYELALYIPFAYADLPEDAYPLSDKDLQYTGTEAKVNMYRLFISAVRAYVESVRISYAIGDCNIYGINRITIKFETAGEPDRAYGVTAGVKEASSLTHYTDTPRDEDAALPVDALDETVLVATSNQLYLAVASGMRPLTVGGSDAERIYARAREILREINGDDSTDLEKVLAIYDWLSDNVIYDYAVSADNPENPNSYNAFYLEGVFDDGIAVCDGLSKAFVLMCGIEGIPAYRICGTEKFSGVGHAWNAVLINGKYYIADVTWSNYKMTLSSESGDEVIEVVSYANFLISADEAEETHRTYGEYDVAGGDNPGYAYSYGIGNGYDTMVDSDEELIYIISEYLPGFVSEDTDIWIELGIDEGYLMAKYDEKDEGDMTGYDVIKGIVADNLPAGYAISMYSGDGVLFVNLTK